MSLISMSFLGASSFSPLLLLSDCGFLFSIGSKEAEAIRLRGQPINRHQPSLLGSKHGMKRL
jgi:hypothetical protein